MIDMEEKMKKEEGRRRTKQIVRQYRKLEEWKNKLQERDITTKFVIPLLQALNWDIYGVTKCGFEVSEEGFPGEIREGQPDIRLTSQTGKVVYVEVKRRIPKNPTKILEEYHRYTAKSRNTVFVVLTNFRKTFIFTKREKGLQQRAIFTVKDYIEEFDKLWQLLSNSPRATFKRGALKATG